MGSEVSLAQILGLNCIDDFIKFVMNDCESECSCSDCCLCHIKTNEIEFPVDEMDFDVSQKGVHIHT
jgi:hypothetical protein